MGFVEVMGDNILNSPCNLLSTQWILLSGFENMSLVLVYVQPIGSMVQSSIHKGKYSYNPPPHHTKVEVDVIYEMQAFFFSPHQVSAVMCNQQRTRFVVHELQKGQIKVKVMSFIVDFEVIKCNPNIGFHFITSKSPFK